MHPRRPGDQGIGQMDRAAASRVGGLIATSAHGRLAGRLQEGEPLDESDGRGPLLLRQTALDLGDVHAARRQYMTIMKETTDMRAHLFDPT